jgi:hypothetical protein
VVREACVVGRSNSPGGEGLWGDAAGVCNGRLGGCSLAGTMGCLCASIKDA